MRAKWLVLLIGLLAVVAAATMAVTQPSAQSAAPAKKEAVLQFSVAIGDPDFDLLKVVSAIRDGAKIGSSDPDGFAVDSFFDIEYRVDLSTGSTSSGGTVKVEIHAVPNNPNVDPVTVINNVLSQIKIVYPKEKKEYVGHVSLLR